MLETPSLLLEIQSIQIWAKAGIKVNVQQVVVVLLILGRKRIHRVVIRRHGIHKVRDRSCQHFEKRIANWIFLAATKCDVFQDVRKTSTIRWGSLECNTIRLDLLIKDHSFCVLECVVRIILENMQMRSLGLRVT